MDPDRTCTSVDTRTDEAGYSGKVPQESGDAANFGFRVVSTRDDQGRDFQVRPFGRKSYESLHGPQVPSSSERYQSGFQDFRSTLAASVRASISRPDLPGRVRSSRGCSPCPPPGLLHTVQDIFRVNERLGIGIRYHAASGLPGGADRVGRDRYSVGASGSWRCSSSGKRGISGCIRESDGEDGFSGPEMVEGLFLDGSMAAAEIFPKYGRERTPSVLRRTPQAPTAPEGITHLWWQSPQRMRVPPSDVQNRPFGAILSLDPAGGSSSGGIGALRDLQVRGYAEKTRRGIHLERLVPDSHASAAYPNAHPR